MNGGTPSSEQLWYLNNAYCRRLVRASNCAGLLEQLLLARGAARDADHAYWLEVVRFIQQNIALLDDDHRHWRHTYYYQSAFHRRMVITEPDVHRALVHFRRLRSRHERSLRDLTEALDSYPRPDPTMTYIPAGDLWTMMAHAIAELGAFLGQPDAATG